MFPRNATSSSISPLSQSYTTKELTLSLTFFNKKTMIINEYHASFVSIDTSMRHPEMSFDLLLDRVKTVTSINKSVLLCHTYNGPKYYVYNLTTRQSQRILNLKIWYNTIKIGMIIKRSKPLHYKIVRFSKPKFRWYDKKFYFYHCIRCELFDSNTWRWKELEEVKLSQKSHFIIQQRYLCSSLHWLIWKRNIFVFDVKMKSYSLLQMPPSVSKDNDKKDIELVEYEKKFVITCMDEINDFMEVWVLEDYNRNK